MPMPDPVIMATFPSNLPIFALLFSLFWFTKNASSSLRIVLHITCDFGTNMNYMLFPFPCQAVVQLTSFITKSLRKIIFVFSIKQTNVGSQFASVDCQDKKGG
jgi:hypothetical protein